MKPLSSNALSILASLTLTLSAGGMHLVADEQVADQTRVPSMQHNSPVMFIENVGQFAEGAHFQARGSDRTIWLAEDAVWVTVLEQGSKETSEQVDKKVLPIRDPQSKIQNRKGVNLKLSFVGANPHPRLVPFNRLDTHVSYFFGNDPAKWHPDVPVWGGVRYVDLYPGIDLEITSENGQAAQRVVAHSNANPSIVRLQVEGADALTLDGNHLRLTTAVGDFALPLLQVVGATLAHPTLAGNQVALPFASATPNLQSPISNLQSPHSTQNPKSEIQNPQSSDLLYATFLGGSSAEYGHGIAVDGSGVTYVTGTTDSSDFPTTPGAFDTTFNGGYEDAFVVKLNAAGSALAYATFLGGSSADYGGGIAVDGSGAAYVSGTAGSSDFPTTPGAFDTTYNGGYEDAFVVKLNAAGSALAYATFLGGSSEEYGHGIAVDGTGAAYVTGGTSSSDFPTTPGAFDTTYNGNWDAFVVKLNAAGSALAYAIFLGGNNGESGSGIAVDESGAAYVTGTTYSSDFPATPGAFDTTCDCTYSADAFVVKLAVGRGAPTVLKQVTPSNPHAFNVGDSLTYTVQIITPTNGVLVFYDRVPTYTTYITDSLNAPASVAYDTPSNAISGTLNLTASVPVTVSFAVRVEIMGTVGFAPLVVNRACVHPVESSLAECLWSNEVWSLTYARLTYLPVILRNH